MTDKQIGYVPVSMNLEVRMDVGKIYTNGRSIRFSTINRPGLLTYYKAARVLACLT